jgi:hypothetical protein
MFCHLQKVKVEILDLETLEKNMGKAKYGSGLNLAQRRHIILRLKCDGTRAETRFGLLAKRTSPFKSAGVSVQSTTGR